MNSSVVAAVVLTTDAAPSSCSWLSSWSSSSHSQRRCCRRRRHGCIDSGGERAHRRYLSLTGDKQASKGTGGRASQPTDVPVSVRKPKPPPSATPAPFIDSKERVNSFASCNIAYPASPSTAYLNAFSLHLPRSRRNTSSDERSLVSRNCLSISDGERVLIHTSRRFFFRLLQTLRGVASFVYFAFLLRRGDHLFETIDESALDYKFVTTEYLDGATVSVPKHHRRKRIVLD